MRIKLGEDEQPEIGLIALIDCIFFLLMFFMVATSFKQPEGEKPKKELPLVLPTAQLSLDPRAAAPSPLVIGVDGRGSVYLDGERVTLAQLHERLKSQKVRSAVRPIRIDGDQASRYQDIVRVLELCQFEGFNTISMRTRQ